MTDEGELRGEKRWVAAVLLMAVAVQVWLFLSLPIFGDEAHTLNASLSRERFLGQQILFYFPLLDATFALFGFGLDQARLVSMIAFTAFLTVNHVLARKTFGPLTALLATALLALHPMMVYHAVEARFYSVNMLVIGVAIHAFYLAVTARSLRWALTATLSASIAICILPSSAFMLAPAGLFLVARWALPGWAERSRDGRTFLLDCAWLLVPTAVALWRYFVLRWADDELGIMMSPPYKRLALTVASGLTLPLIIAAAAALTLGPRRLMGFWGLAWLAPLALAQLLAPFMQIQGRYVLPVSLPVCLLAAAFLTSLARNAGRARLGLGIAGFLLLVSASLPTLVSNMTEGNGFDYPGALEFVRARDPGATLVVRHAPHFRYAEVRMRGGDERAVAEGSDEGLIGFYEFNADRASFLHRSEPVYLLLPYSRRGLVAGKYSAPELEGWLAEHAGLVGEVGRPRLDRLHDRVRIYRLRGQSR